MANSPLSGHVTAGRQAPKQIRGLWPSDPCMQCESSLPVDSGSGARIQHRARRTDVRTRGEDAGRARTGTAAEPRAGGPGARATHVCPRPRFAPRSPSSPARPGRCVCVTACAGPDRCCQVHAPRESDVVVQFVLYPCLLVGHWCMPSQVRGQEGFCVGTPDRDREKTCDPVFVADRAVRSSDHD